MNKNQIANNIFKKYHTDDSFKATVDESPEFYRACVYESGFVDAKKMDGTEDYFDLVDILERAFNPD